MPLWKVKRGRDAYAIEETIVEAESAEQAEQIATDRDNRDVVKWVDTGEVVTFDDTRLFDGETKEVAPGTADPVERKSIAVTDQELSTILAALRMWTDNLMRGPDYFSDALLEIATNGDKHDLLAPEAIDALCERINV